MILIYNPCCLTGPKDTFKHLLIDLILQIVRMQMRDAVTERDDTTLPCRQGFGHWAGLQCKSRPDFSDQIPELVSET